MAPTKHVNKKDNVKKRNPNKAITKSKYFNKTQNNGAKRTAKHIGKQPLSGSGKDEKNVPKLGALSSPNGSITSFNPQVFGKRLTRDFFDTPTEFLAVALLGKVLCRKTEKGEILCGKIIETEAYLGEIDPACHAYGGKRTARNAPMYGPPGTAYVYFIYGMYHCFNVSSKEAGACVLIRALEPVTGES
jgi:DNA-3-methyladenine glycosylase